MQRPSSLLDHSARIFYSTSCLGWGWRTRVLREEGTFFGRLVRRWPCPRPAAIRSREPARRLNSTRELMGSGNVPANRVSSPQRQEIDAAGRRWRVSFRPRRPKWIRADSEISRGNPSKPSPIRLSPFCFLPSICPRGPSLTL